MRLFTWQKFVVSDLMCCRQDVSTTSGWAQYRCFDSAEAAGSAAVRQIRVGTRKI